MIHGQPVRLAAKNGQWGYFVDLLSVHQEYRGLGLAPVLISKMADYRGIREDGGGRIGGEIGGEHRSIHRVCFGFARGACLQSSCVSASGV